MGARAYHRNNGPNAKKDEMIATHQEMAAALATCGFLAQLDSAELDRLQDYINAKTQTTKAP